MHDHKRIHEAQFKRFIDERAFHASDLEPSERMHIDSVKIQIPVYIDLNDVSRIAELRNEQRKLGVRFCFEVPRHDDAACLRQTRIHRAAPYAETDALLAVYGKTGAEVRRTRPKKFKVVFMKRNIAEIVRKIR